MYSGASWEPYGIYFEDLKMEAVSHATLSMVCTGNKGSAFAVAFPVRVNVELLDKKTIDVKGTQRQIARNTVKKVLKLFNKDYGVKVVIESDIPAKVGLGEKEAVSVATALATVGAIAKKDGAIMLLRIDKYLDEQFYIVDKKIVNRLEIAKICEGRFDRVCASLFGGFSVTDNSDILRRGEMENLDVSVFSQKMQKVPSLLDTDMQSAWQETLKGNLYTAIKMNALIQGQMGAVEKRINAGALTVGVTKDSVYALTRKGKVRSRIAAHVMNEPSKVISKPKRIAKIRKFLELKGEQEYYFL